MDILEKSYILVDGSGFIHRAFHAFPPLTDTQGRPVGALYGFARMILPLLTQAERGALYVFFDAGRQTFRHELYAEYKTNRRQTDTTLAIQFPFVRQFCTAFSIPHFEHLNFEADDLIASFATQIAEKGSACTIVSSDKDLIQLINPHIALYDPMKKAFITPESVLNKYGILPEKMIAFQALVGDQSDCIPGVPGIGPKTAASLLQTYNSLEGIYAHLSDIMPPKVQEKISTYQEQAFLSRDLVTLKRDINIPENISALPLDKDKARRFLEVFSFTTLLPFLDHFSSHTTAA
ncbi:MAG: hypothetical protein LBH38_01780 [Holosporales bacterium]|jgi:DNA polymerase-1|nr:hypothetical protein [Holosporales bacterium]